MSQLLSHYNYQSCMNKFKATVGKILNSWHLKVLEDV